MELLTREAFETLAKEKAEYCVSLYLPVHRTGREVQQDPRHFEDMLKEAQKKLEEKGLKKTDAEKLLEKARDLLDHQDFWVNQKDGLVVLISPTIFATFKLPVELKEDLHVGEQFQLTQLLPLLHSNSEFYILAVSENGVRLLRGSQETSHEIFHDQFGGKEGAIGKETDTKTSQAHKVSSAGGGYTQMHGQGGFKDAQKDDIIEYLRMIEKRFLPLLSGEHAPLVFAGADPLFGFFKQVNSYPNLIEEFIEGNPDRLTEQELHDKAWPFIESVAQDSMKEVVQQCIELMGSEKVSDDIAAIIPLAIGGKVERLFVAKGAELKGSLTELNEIEEGDDDLLNIAAIHTILHRGDVFSVEPGMMPDGAVVLAILRS